MHVTDSQQRRNRILESIIEAYVSTAVPVGSELIARKLRSTLSPATIRHVMGELEAEGLVEQPHTSAGRVPTDRGYRFYVDAVMDARPLSAEEIRQLDALLQAEALELDQVMARASSMLAELCHQAAFVVAPTVKRSTVKQVELVPLSVRRLLCVLVAGDEMIASHVVEIREPMGRDEVDALSRFINGELVGLPVHDLLASLERRMLGESDSFYHFVKRSLDILQDALSTEPDERFFLDGASYVVSQPEFSRDPHQTHELLKVLDAEEALLTRVGQDLATGDGVRMRIGRETQVPGLETCSYVAAPFMAGREVIGGVGVLGPKRMDYPRVRALVEAMARAVNAVWSR